MAISSNNAAPSYNAHAPALRVNRSSAMDDLDDELDLRFHRGMKADVYYRVPTSESLDGALRNELERNASSLIPSDIVTEFVFAAASTVTIPVTHQATLNALIEPRDYPQSFQVEYALCRDFDGKDRLGIQRAISKSIVAAIEDADGFKYSERHAYNPKSGGDGARFRYVCQDSLENKDRKANKKKKEVDAEDSGEATVTKKELVPTYDCGGAVHVRFSIKRDAIHVVYKHNPIHRDAERRRNNDGKSGNPEANGTSAPQPMKSRNGTTKKRKRSQQDDHVADDEDFHNPDPVNSSMPEASRSPLRKKKKNPSVKSTAKKTERSKKVSASASSPTKSRKKAAPKEPNPTRRLAKNKACIRCREKKIKCNEAKPTCNQCERGLWTCQYEFVGPKPRSKNGCVNCKQRRRKCTEEKPSCAYCLRVDDDCEYAEYS
ncbi:hypothetical protein OPT61_g9836 [Boeremia exigua]|uniref:Uncharacterized protein n=1 Tax=Boeremia exigua TaxID=749465 RepID=A0ACC2HTZ5_9PLEO|nr:hypothetical protein OPT61_g9836 [Boeremia exigua]